MTDNVVTVHTVVQECQGLIEQVRVDTKMPLEKKINGVVKLCNTQLRAGALNIAYQKARPRIAEDNDRVVLTLTGPKA